LWVLEPHVGIMPGTKYGAYPHPPHVTTPNLVGLGQTVWVGKGSPKHFGDAGASPLEMGAWLTE